ncbi:SecDF P1 head subdomain-containing protein [Chitinimonas sp. BJB300]|uniref:SecDF P1 head subdomain-containing protein n=1 Tax=Chitinimonas sp. BJB300 TaxID=1559339 RepID=UPI000C11AF6B|nr:hypothetical protein [Chitinimonas sp. BJB300]PHV10759.1 hypothetical protein CSQ89_14545 [Chitinimonas sp. BJB300]TSJ89980.1 hypothetical protein FG002_007255 [Chitinimonas sp. BJB300]
MCFQWRKFAALCYVCGFLGYAQAAEVAFSSVNDFTDIDLRIKRDGNTDITLMVKLNPEARARLEKVTRDSLGQQLMIYINDQVVGTPMVKGVINGEELQLSLSNAAAGTLLPTFLEKTASQKPVK